MSRRQLTPSNMFYRKADPLPPNFPSPNQGDYYYNTTRGVVRMYLEVQDSNPVTYAWQDLFIGGGGGGTPVDPGDEDLWVNETGDTMTGQLTMKNADILFHSTGSSWGENTVRLHLLTRTEWLDEDTNYDGPPVLAFGSQSDTDDPVNVLYVTDVGIETTQIIQHGVGVNMFAGELQASAGLYVDHTYEVSSSAVTKEDHDAEVRNGVAIRNYIYRVGTTSSVPVTGEIHIWDTGTVVIGTVYRFRMHKTDRTGHKVYGLGGMLEGDPIRFHQDTRVGEYPSDGYVLRDEDYDFNTGPVDGGTYWEFTGYRKTTGAPGAGGWGNAISELRVMADGDAISITLKPSRWVGPIPYGGAEDQVLKMTGGVPTWGTGGASGSGDKYYEHTQSLLASTWTVVHNLGKKPSVAVADAAGAVLYGTITYVNDNSLTVKFNTTITGKAYCS